MKNVIRVTEGNLRIVLAISDFQTVSGITSKAGNGSHYVLWDFDNRSLEICAKALRYIQRKYSLSDIYIFSDSENSCHGICYSKFRFRKMIEILASTPNIDLDYVAHTIDQGKATIRLSEKIGREKMSLVKTIYSKWSSIAPPENIEDATYECSLEKTSKLIDLNLGGDDKI